MENNNLNDLNYLSNQKSIENNNNLLENINNIRKIKKRFKKMLI